jgi:ribosomal protein L30E
MRVRTHLTPAIASIAAAGTIMLGITTTSQAAAKPQGCASITKAVVVADGFKSATKPKITHYSYSKPASNAANALGTTIDFGPKALVVSCVSPADLKKLSVAAQGKMAPTMSAASYMTYLVNQSAGAMKQTPVGGVSDYLDFGNGKEDGLGSTAKASSVRLDAWVAGNYIILTQTAPVSATPSPALLSFISTTQSSL